MTPQEKIKQLKKENKSLRETLEIAMNKPLVKDLIASIKDIKDGNYISLEDFDKNKGKK